MKKGVSGSYEPAVLRADRGGGLLLGEEARGITAEERDDVVADGDVVGLELGIADDGEGSGLDLVLGEGVDRKADGEGDEGLGVEVVELGLAAAGGGGAVDLAADQAVKELLVVDHRWPGCVRAQRAESGLGGGDRLRELLLAAAAFLGEGGRGALGSVAGGRERGV